MLNFRCDWCVCVFVKVDLDLIWFDLICVYVCLLCVLVIFSFVKNFFIQIFRSLSIFYVKKYQRRRTISLPCYSESILDWKFEFKYRKRFSMYLFSFFFNIRYIVILNRLQTLLNIFFQFWFDLGRNRMRERDKPIEIKKGVLLKHFALKMRFNFRKFSYFYQKNHITYDLSLSTYW